MRPTRSAWQDLIAVAPVTMIVSVTFGAATVAAGFPAASAIIMSVAMFSGAAQFAAVGILASGGSAFAAWAAAMLISARFGILAISIATRLRFTLLERVGASIMLVDPNALVAIAHAEDRDARRAFWVLGWSLYALFILGTAVGALSGSLLTERFAVVAIDVALPSFLAGLVVQGMRTRETRTAPVLGIVVAIAMLAFASPEVAILAAPVGTLVLLLPWIRRWTGGDR
jgi:4-azaleucine resistance transporter AzlC